MFENAECIIKDTKENMEGLKKVVKIFDLFMTGSYDQHIITNTIVNETIFAQHGQPDKLITVFCIRVKYNYNIMI